MNNPTPDNPVFVVRYRTHNKGFGKLSLPCDLYSPEECDAFADDIRREGYADVTTGIEDLA